MTKQLAIRESVTDAPVKSGNRWRVVVARPGKGSSGTYSEDLFRRDASKLIPPGAQSFINHGERDPEKMIGVFPDGGYFDEAEKAVVAELQVFEHWKAWVEEVAPYVGMSLYAMGEADEDGNVVAIHEDAYNGADLVARAGLSGSKIADKLYEAAVSAGSEQTKATAALERKDNEQMDEKVIEALEALTAQVSELVASKKNAEAAEAQAQADAEAIAEAVASFQAAVVAVDEADLLAPQKAEILEAAKSGADVAPLIESAKAVKAAALEAVQVNESHGRDFGGNTSKSYTVAGWSN